MKFVRYPLQVGNRNAPDTARGWRELDLADFILEHGLQAEIVAPGAHMPTVDAAAAAMKVASEQIFKSILFQARDGHCVMVVACGNGRVDLRRVEPTTGL